MPKRETCFSFFAFTEIYLLHTNIGISIFETCFCMEKDYNFQLKAYHLL